MTPIGLEMLSPRERLMASPWRSILDDRNFGWVARLFEDRCSYRSRRDSCVPCLPFLLFFSSIFIGKACGLRRGG